MRSLFKNPFVLAFAALALSAGAGQSQNLREARLGAERLALQSHPSAQPPLFLPAALGNPTAVYSVVRLSTWRGNCAIVQRLSDYATKTIGWAGNVCDKASADAFKASPTDTLSISTWYDQSGNGYNLTAASALNQPAYTALNEWMGLRPVSFWGLGSSGYVGHYLQGAFSGATGAVTVYMLASPRNSYTNETEWDFTTASYAASLLNIGMNATTSAFAINVNNALYANSTLIIPDNLETMSLSASSSAGAILRVAGQEYDNASAVTNASIIDFRLGFSVAGNTWAANFDAFAVVVYPAAHVSSDMQTVEAALSKVAAPVALCPNNLVYGGSSLVTSQYSSFGQQAPWQAGWGCGRPGIAGTYNLYVTALSGRALASEAAKLTTWEKYYSSSFARNVFVMDAPSNDISSANPGAGAGVTWADNFYTNTFLPFVSNLKAYGFKVVVPTTIARCTFTAEEELARQEYNARVRSGAGTYGYTVSDRAYMGGGAGTTFDHMPSSADGTGCYNTTYYYSDGTHLISTGANSYGILAAVDQAAILAAP